MNAETYAVVGGGASGIATAYYLQQHGIDIELIEREAHLGGRIGSCRLGDRPMEMGGKNIGKNYRLFREFSSAISDQPYEYFGLNSSRVRNGQMLTMDSKHRWRSIVKFLSRCSLKDIFWFLRMYLAVKQNEHNGYLGGSHFASLSQRFDEKPASTYFSKEFCDLVIRPMAVISNAAEPDEVFIGNLGTNIHMIQDSYERLSNGMEALLNEFAKTVRVRLETQVESLVYRDNHVIGLQMLNQGKLQEREYAGVILTTPAPITAKLVEPFNPDLAQTLQRIRYFPVTLIVAEYNRDIFSDQIRALAFDADEPISNAAAYSINSLNIVRYTFSGRTARRHLESGTGTTELLRIAESTLNKHIPVEASDRVRFVAKQYSTGLCAYTPHYAEFHTVFQSQQETLQGLYITGDYMQGASIEGCFRAAKACVEQVLQSRIDNSTPKKAQRMPAIVSLNNS